MANVIPNSCVIFVFCHTHPLILVSHVSSYLSLGCILKEKPKMDILLLKTIYPAKIINLGLAVAPKICWGYIIQTDLNEPLIFWAIDVHTCIYLKTNKNTFKLQTNDDNICVQNFCLLKRREKVHPIYFGFSLLRKMSSPVF